MKLKIIKELVTAASLKDEKVFKQKNKNGQTRLHWLMKEAQEEEIANFLSNEMVISFFYKMDTSIFEIADDSKKLSIHYLFMRKEHPDIEKAIKNLLPLLAPLLTKVDDQKMTPLHYSAKAEAFQRLNFFVETLPDNCEVFSVFNGENQSFVDIVQEKLSEKKSDKPWAKKLYLKEFTSSPFYNYLKDHFIREQKLVSSKDEVQNTKQFLLTEIMRLAKTIVIEDEVEPKIRNIFDELKLEIKTTPLGIELTPAQLDEDEIYALTPIGEIEILLQKNIAVFLRGFLFMQELPQELKSAQEDFKEAEHQYYDAWDEYNEASKDYEEGEYEEYDYEGPIAPQIPKIASPDPVDEDKVAKKLRTELVQAPISELLEKIAIEEGVLGDLLYNAFNDMELLDDLVKNLLKIISVNKTNIDPKLIENILRNMNLYFSDIDITQRGFFLKIFKKSIRAESEFKEVYSQSKVTQVIQDFFYGIARHPELIQAARRFNNAAQFNDNLIMQKSWLELLPFAQRTLEYSENQKKKKQPGAQLTRSLSMEFLHQKGNEKFKETQEKIKKLCKIFPSDQCDFLYYPGILEDDPRHNYPAVEARLAIMPIFKTLRYFSQQTHQLIVKNGKNGAETTNTVAAMLSFVVSTLPLSQEKKLVAEGKADLIRRQFINIPILLDYKPRLLSVDSKDGVFADSQALLTSVAKDNQVAANVLGITVDKLPAKQKKAQDMLENILGTLNLPPERKAEMLKEIRAAAVEKPVELDAYLKVGVQSSTEINHSERVFFHALKQPKNIQKILQQLEGQLRKEILAAADLLAKSPSKAPSSDLDTYTIHAVVLFLFSYPNSVCQPCGLGVIACQTPSQAPPGFMQQLIHFVNQPPGGTRRYFRTRGYDEKKKQQDFKEFNLTTIAASEEIFPNDLQGQLMKSRPKGRFHCRESMTLNAKLGINIKHNPGLEQNDRFYEYLEAQVAYSLPLVPFEGHLFMSGSKLGKLRAGKPDLLEQILEETLQAHAKLLLPPVAEAKKAIEPSADAIPMSDEESSEEDSDEPASPVSASPKKSNLAALSLVAGQKNFSPSSGGSSPPKPPSN